MDIGLVTYGDLEQVSGGYRYNRKLVEYLRERGDRVTVVSLPARDGVRAFADSVSRRVRRQLDHPYDVLLQDELCYRSLLGHTRQLDEPERVIALVHLLELPGAAGRLHRLGGAIERRYLAGVDACIATSRHTARQIRATTDTPTAVAYPGGRNGDGTADQRTIAERARRGPLEIAFVGNVVPRKGTHTLVDALPRVDGEWRATIVGDHPDRDYTERIDHRIAELPNESDVTMLGRVSDERLRSVLERSDVLAVPSAYESFGMVYLEAMEHGAVPIATTVGGASELVSHGSNGFLVPPDSPDRLGRYLSTLATDRERLARMGVRAAATAQAHPNWDESMARVRSVLAGEFELDTRARDSTERRAQR